MTTEPTPTPHTPQIVIRYPNQSGALVIVRRHQAYGGIAEHPRPLYDALCTGCLDEPGMCLETALKIPRRWAAEHSATCRALPQPENTDQPGGTA